MKKIVKGSIAILFASVSVSTGLSINFQDLTGGFDVLVKDDIDFSSGNIHIHGNTAAGGNVYSRDSEYRMDNVAGSEFGLLVGGQLVLSGNQSKVLNSGKARIGTQGSLGLNAAGNRIGTNNGGDNTRLELNGATQTLADTFGPSSFDFDSTFTALEGFSSDLRDMTPTLDSSSVFLGNNRLNFLSSSSDLEVFNLSAGDFGSFAEIDFSGFVSGVSKLVINVDLTGFAGTFGKNIVGDSNTPADNVLWNFYGSNSLTLQNQFTGSILATGIDLTHFNNDLKGSVIADSFTKQGGQVHVHRFDMDIPNIKVPDSASTGLLMLLVLPALVWARRIYR